MEERTEYKTDTDQKETAGSDTVERLVIKPCPFCGKIPEKGEMFGQVHMETLKFEIATCRTDDCAMGHRSVCLDEWNVRAL
jgi:hypothetical protein